MRRMLAWAWLAVVAGIMGWSVRTLPAPRPQVEALRIAVNEPAIPPVHRLRVPLASDLGGGPAGRGQSVHFLPSRGPDDSVRSTRFIFMPAPPAAAAALAAGTLPYFPTGPPPSA